MIRKFKNIEEYNTFTHNGKDMVSGDLYWVEDNKSAFFLTNNIDGEVKSYDMFDEIPEEYIVPSGNIAITENGEGIDVTQYASASVNVPIPEGYIIPSGNKEITANGTNIDVNNYATASVNVPIPDGYIQPSGNIAITENGENIDVTNYATATVNVPSTGGAEDLISFIQGDITTLNIPDGTTKIGDGIFAYTSLNTVTIPDSVTSIGEYAFAYSFLRNVTIPDSVTSIGQNAFYDCINISKVTIGSGVTEINSYAFKKCTYLDSITIKATTPPTLGSDVFGDDILLKIYVPAASVDAYKTATNWSQYANIIKAIQGETVNKDEDFQHGIGEGGDAGEGDIL